MLSNSGNISCLTTIVQHVHFELLGVSPDLINRPTAYFYVPGNRKGVVVLGLNRPRR